MCSLKKGIQKWSEMSLHSSYYKLMSLIVINEQQPHSLITIAKYQMSFCSPICQNANVLFCNIGVYMSTVRLFST